MTQLPDASAWLGSLADDLGPDDLPDLPAPPGAHPEAGHSQTLDGHRSSRAILGEAFVEQPVALDEFIADRRYIGMGPLSTPQAAVLHAAERIYYPELYPHMAAEFDPGWALPPEETVKNFVTLLVGKGGGKDMIARLVSLRIAYLLLCLRDPKGYFGMPTDESIHLLNVAATRDQARLAFFEPMTRITARGWWADKCEPLKKVIEWDRGITTLSGSSDADTQEGLNLLLGVADEVDAFRTEDDAIRTGNTARAPQRSAEGILKMLRSSAITRFPRTFKNLRISYPRYYGSPILKLHSQALRDNEVKGPASRHFVIGPLPSWDFNPLLRRSRFVHHPNAYTKGPDGNVAVRIPEEWVDDFTNDPGWARAAYLCDPERTRRPAYFRSPNVIEAAMVASPEIIVRWEFARGAWQVDFSIPRDLAPTPGAVYACHADLALKKDRAGFAISHVRTWDAYESRDLVTGAVERWEHLPVIVVDAVVGFAADPEADPPREIQLRAVRQLVFELRQRGFRIERVSLDGFQSVSTRQEIEVAGISAPLYSVDRSEDPYRMLRAAVEESRVQMPYSTLLLNELLGLSQDHKTRRVDHEPGGSKDLADAVCGSVNGAALLGGQEDSEETEGVDFWVGGGAGELPIGATGALSDMIGRGRWDT